ncbi:MAG: SIR2 family protein [Chloroflexi bacterium]|nr:SIR2 family protein [Chloroflexota bacterium]
MTPGHVFIIRGDLTKLHCDVWLVPTDALFQVRSAWRKRLSERARQEAENLWARRTDHPRGWGDHGERVFRLGPYPPEASEAIPYLVNVGADSSVAARWYVNGVAAFLKRVHDDGIARKTTMRARPLVALNLAGTGGGGAGDIAGHVVFDLIDTLFAAAQQYGFDIVLVTWTAAAFAATQVRRQQVLEARGISVAALLGEGANDRLTATVEWLSRHAAGSLVLFLGAGVSQAAGLPGWKELLAKLATVAAMSASDQKALSDLSYPDQAHIVRSRLQAQGKSLRDEIRKLVATERYALAHGLLASMPVREIVTTNYDTLFEIASEAAEQPAAVLPYEPVARKDRWLLKLHGCIERPRADERSQVTHDIVLTREDYLRYDSQRGALAGIVQAMLITKQMLFVGFSLKDDNFIRMVDDVRKIVHRGGPDGAVSQVGTALFLDDQPLLRELWSGDVDVINVGGVAQTQPEQARQLEIFLDVLLAAAIRAVPPLLDPAYDGMIDAEHQALAQCLRELHDTVGRLPREAAIRQPVDELLRQFGRTGGDR